MTAETESVNADFNRRSATVLIAVGVLSLIAGLLALIYPDITLLALALIAGINLLLLGILAIVNAIVSDRDATVRVLGGVLGMVGVIGGLVVMRRPGESLLAILLILGVWFVVSGLVDAVRAIVQPEDRMFRLLTATVDIILGALILSLPELSLKTLAVLTGIAFIVRGAFAIYAGMQLRNAAPASPSPTAQPGSAGPLPTR